MNNYLEELRNKTSDLSNFAQGCAGNPSLNEEEFVEFLRAKEQCEIRLKEFLFWASYAEGINLSKTFRIDG